MSKYILLYSENNEILSPQIFSTYKEAFEKMSDEVRFAKTDNDIVRVHEDSASVQGNMYDLNWRIWEIKSDFTSGIDKDILTKVYLESAYNEDTDYEIRFYIDPKNHKQRAKAYMYTAEENSITPLRIANIIHRSDNFDFYDSLLRIDDVLLHLEELLGADTSAEFITDDDCMLVFFYYA